MEFSTACRKKKGFEKQFKKQQEAYTAELSQWRLKLSQENPALFLKLGEKLKVPALKKRATRKSTVKKPKAAKTAKK